MQAVGAVQLDSTLVVRVYQLVSDRVVRHGLRHPLIAAEDHLPLPTGRARTHARVELQTEPPKINRPTPRKTNLSHGMLIGCFKGPGL